MADRIRLVVVEDHTLVREGLVSMLEAHDDLDVAGQAGDGREAIAMVRDLQPDIVLLDLRLPEIDGLEVLRTLKAECPGVHVLVLTVHEEQAYVTEAMRAGADGYLLKTVHHAEVVDAIRRVVQGEAVLHPAVARTVLSELAALSRGDGVSRELSSREKDVIRLLAHGLSNRQIAERLGLGVETVKTHISSILTKLGAVDRTQAVALAMRQGLIE